MITIEGTGRWVAVDITGAAEAWAKWSERTAPGATTLVVEQAGDTSGELEDTQPYAYPG